MTEQRDPADVGALPSSPVFRGCCAVVFLLFAVFMALFSFAGTVEMETFPGLRENRAPLVVYLLVFAVLVGIAGLACAGWRNRGGWFALAILGALIAVRMWTLTPMLHCWSYDTVGREDDGSYTCYNRDMTVG
ncbi:hypothetical protein [Streptomyces sp. NPDC018693]|uniref:hypothetical protein n=1 Tax=unclassified Streptomyces TaxID=2593676 RepID=UPI0037ADAABD